jgi:peroxiredoxin
MTTATGRARIWALAFLTLLAIGFFPALVAADRSTPSLGQIGEFSLNDVAGGQHSRDEWSGKQAVVLFFLGAECPVSNGYSPEMRRICEAYAPRGVACYGVHVDATLSADEAAQHAKEYGLPFAILLDPRQSVAGMAGVRVTPDAIVARPDGQIVYRGRIDDRYSIHGKRRDDPTTHELVDALEAVLTGMEPAVRESKAFGCPLLKLRD